MCIGRVDPSQDTKASSISLPEGQKRPEGMIIVPSREKKLLRRLAQGKTDKQIRAEIGGREDKVSPAASR